MNQFITSIYDLPIVNDILRETESKILAVSGLKIEVYIRRPEMDETDMEYNIQVLKRAVSIVFKMPWSEIIKQNRKDDRVDARHTYMFLRKTELMASNREAALEVGNKDHTTCINAVKKIWGFYETGGDPLLPLIEQVKKIYNAERKETKIEAVKG